MLGIIAISINIQRTLKQKSVNITILFGKCFKSLLTEIGGYDIIIARSSKGNSCYNNFQYCHTYI